MDWLTAFRDKTFPGAQPGDDLSTGGAVSSMVSLPGGGVFDALGEDVADVQAQVLSKSARVLTSTDFDDLRALVGKRGMLWRSRLVSAGVPDGAIFYLPFNSDGNRANLTARDGSEASVASGSVIGVDDGKFGSGAVSLTQGFTNYIYYPSLSVAWTPANIHTSVVTDYSYAGGQSMKVHKATGDTGYSAYPVPDSSVNTLANGNSLTLSAYIYLPSSSVATGAKFRIKDNTNGVTYWSDEVTATDEWTLATVTFTNNTGATVNIGYYLNISGTAGDNCYYYLDSAQITKTAYQLPYRDYTMNGVTGSASGTSVATGALLKYANPLSPQKGAIGGWVKVDDNVSYGGEMLWSLGATNGEFDAFISPVEFITFRQNGSITQLTAPTAGTWFHIVISWDFSASEIKYFINGAQVGATVSYTTLLSFSAVAGILCSDNLASTYTTNGYGADWFLSTEPISVADIAAIYNAGIALDAARIQKGIDARCMGLSAKRAAENVNHIDVALDFATIGEWRGEVRRLASAIISSFLVMTLTNNGDARARNLVVTIIATGAASVVLSVNGFTMTISGLTAANDELVVDCGARTVTLNGADNYSGVTFGTNTTADWLPLEPGDNMLSVTLSGADVEVIAQWWDTWR